MSNFRTLLAIPLLLTATALPLPAEPAAAAAAADDVPALIEDLLEVNSMETFYAGTFRFAEFPPLDKAPLAEFPFPADADPADAAFRSLIRLLELGPQALPDLLQHLDDKRETKTVVSDDFAKSMGPSTFVDFRADNAREASAIKQAGLPRENPGPDFDESLDDYTLTVGDMCFALIGMITNRSYYIVVDEFDAQLNSPTRSESIVSAVRSIWGAHPGNIELYEQLKNDLESGSPRYSNGAARRLLYYFPGHSHNLVKARLATLMQEHQPGSEELAEFLKALAWSTNPEVMSTLRRFLLTTTDAAQIAAASAVYANLPDPRGHQQLLQLADKLKLRRDPGHVKASRIVLGLNLLTFPAQRKETVVRFLKGAGAYAKASACLICEGIEDAPVSALLPLLSDKSRSTGDRYLIKGEGAEKWPENDDYLPYRTCDRAYETISRLLGDQSALATGTHAEMDARIEALAARLEGKPATWKFSASEIKSRQKEQNKYRKAG